jgi:hypothetical protein
LEIALDGHVPTQQPSTSTQAVISPLFVEIDLPGTAQLIYNNNRIISTRQYNSNQ